MSQAQLDRDDVVPPVRDPQSQFGFARDNEGGYPYAQPWGVVTPKAQSSPCLGTIWSSKTGVLTTPALAREAHSAAKNNATFIFFFFFWFEPLSREKRVRRREQTSWIETSIVVVVDKMCSKKIKRPIAQQRD
jgi:hypothetical protein